MFCPCCATPLEAVERLGVEMDHCPTCNGLWLDAGELDALVERESVAALRQGERVLAASRRGKEYDHTVHETDESGGRYGVVPGIGTNVAFSMRRVTPAAEEFRAGIEERELALR